jgi:hypothetical protein
MRSTSSVPNNTIALNVGNHFIRSRADIPESRDPQWAGQHWIRQTHDRTRRRSASTFAHYRGFATIADTLGRAQTLRAQTLSTPSILSRTPVLDHPEANFSSISSTICRPSSIEQSTEEESQILFAVAHEATPHTLEIDSQQKL